MLSFIILVLLLDFAAHIEVGYKEIPIRKSDPEYYGYRSDDLDSVTEYYEQKKSGYFELLDNDGKIGGEGR